MLFVGIDLTTFDTIYQPDPASQQLALERLKLLKAVDNHNEVTEIGMQMAKFPMDADVARMLVAPYILLSVRDTNSSCYVKWG